jgi:uncharacterized protein (PEP-CTERM system associated)
MAAAQLGAKVRGSPRPLFRFLASAALTVWAFAGAYAQMAATPSSSPPAAAPAPQPTNDTAAPGTGGGATIGAPALRLTGLSFTASGQLSETYTNNAFGIPNVGSFVTGYTGTDLITTMGLTLGAHDHGARFDGDLGYTLTGYLSAYNPTYDHVYNTINALANATIVQERLYLHAVAYATPTLINSFGALGAAGNNFGLRDSYAYTIAPELRFRLGDFAKSVTTVTQSGLFFTNPGGPQINQTIPGIPNAPASLMQYGASESLLSGPDFYHLNWILTGTVSRWEEAGLVFDQVSGVTNLRYAITHALSITSLAGYSAYSSNQQLTHSISGVFALVGLQYAPTPDLSASASAGRQFNYTSYIGNFTYRIGPLTTLTGQLTDTLTPPGGGLIGGLGNLGVNGAGNFYNTTFSPFTPPTTITNVTAFNPAQTGQTSIISGITRFRAASVSLVHISERTQYRLTGYDTIYDTLTPVGSGLSPNGTSTGVQMVVSRAMTPRLTGSIQLDYSVLSDLGSRFSLYQGTASLGYSLSPTLQTYFNAAYMQRSSGNQLSGLSPLSGSLTGVSVTIGISKKFL